MRVEPTNVRTRQRISLPPAEAMAILTGAEALLNVQRRGLTVLGRHIPTTVRFYEDRVVLVTDQLHRDVRLTRNVRLEVRIRPEGGGSTVDVIAHAGGPQCIALALVCAWALTPVFRAFPRVGVGIWGLLALACGLLAWRWRCSATPVYRSLFQSVWSTLAPYQRHEAALPYRGLAAATAPHAG